MCSALQTETENWTTTTKNTCRSGENLRSHKIMPVHFFSVRLSIASLRRIERAAIYQWPYELFYITPIVCSILRVNVITKDNAIFRDPPATILGLPLILSHRVWSGTGQNPVTPTSLHALSFRAEVTLWGVPCSRATMRCNPPWRRHHRICYWNQNLLKTRPVANHQTTGMSIPLYCYLSCVCGAGLTKIQGPTLILFTLGLWDGDPPRPWSSLHHLPSWVC
jgi:hypothetical protein